MLLFHIALLFIAFSAGNARANTCFDDQSLADLLSHSAQQRGALVYVWSPRMVYSVQNMTLASRAAAAAGLDFVVLHDMRVPPAEIDLATPPFLPLIDSSRALCAKELIHREALRHFPTAFVIGPQGLHAHAIVGAMPAGAWASSISARLQPGLRLP